MGNALVVDHDVEDARRNQVLVVFGADTSYGSATLAPNLSHFHEVVLNDLACGTTYHARVTAETEAGASSWTRNLSFATDACSPEPPPLF